MHSPVTLADSSISIEKSKRKKSTTKSFHFVYKALNALISRGNFKIALPSQQFPMTPHMTFLCCIIRQRCVFVYPVLITKIKKKNTIQTINYLGFILMEFYHFTLY